MDDTAMSMKILIVDDDQVDRIHIKRMMKRSDPLNSIIEVEDVDSAISVLSEQQFDAILLDYNMPKKNGLELLKEVRCENLDENSAIIMMSTSEEEELAMECLQAGAQDFIAKSDITGYRLRRAILGAQARFNMEQKLKESYQKVKQLAEQDNLTKLANRYVFDESLKTSIENNKRNHCKMGLVLFDLDHFKYVNDTHGHDVGDTLLKEVVERIHTCLRGTETFARLGGDEFAIILEHLERVDETEKVALRILRALIKPFKISEAKINMSASVGIAISPDDALSASDLFKRADMAMYKAKALGRNQIAFFEEAMQRHFLSRYKIESALKTALEKRQLELYYQPVYGVKSTRVIGFEALLRWHSDQGLISPDIFIPIAEECKLICPIGRWVISQACQKLNHWQQKFKEPLTMSINLSPVQLSDDFLLAHIKKCLDVNELPASSIEFEITETALLDDSVHTEQIINKISQLGCTIALDDFGTGFSSLSHLHQFPIDTVKIDKSLMPSSNIDSMKNTQSNEKIVHALVAMLKYLDLNIVAEGLESLSHLRLCQSLNIQKLQGYYLSKPMSADKIDNIANFITKQSVKKNIQPEVSASAITFMATD
jgi:diguanylate cyclase (GGDEF)-like protein